MEFFYHGDAKTRRSDNAVTMPFSQVQKPDSLSQNPFRRHPGESRDPVKTIRYKIPAFAGMTKKKVPDIPRDDEEHFTSPRLRASAVKAAGGLA